MKPTPHTPALNTASEHTPGEWTLGKGLFTVREAADSSFSGFICRTRIAGEPHRTDGEDHANARLIAAAPDLLAALEESLTWMETYQRQTGTAEHGPLGHSITKARAALARAKGGEVS